MAAATTALSWRFLKRASIPVDRKVLAVRSVILTKGLFNAGTWPSLFAAEFNRMHTSIMRIYARVLDDGYDPNHVVPYEYMLKWHKVTAPYLLLMCLRVNLFVRLLMSVERAG